MKSIFVFHVLAALTSTGCAAAATTFQPQLAKVAPQPALSASDVAVDDALEDCDLRAIDAETPFDGPGWDRARDAPRETQDAYLVHTTVLVLKTDKSAQAEFRRLNAAMAEQLLKHEGLIGFKVAGSTRCRTARTLAVWRDARSMRAFVGSPEHTDAMRKFANVADNGKFTHWEATSKEMPPSWQQARRQLSSVRAIFKSDAPHKTVSR